jgi:hypothetical protein
MLDRILYVVDKSDMPDLGLDGRIIFRCILIEQGGDVCTGFMWPRTGTSVQLLNMIMNFRVP